MTDVSTDLERFAGSDHSGSTICVSDADASEKPELALQPKPIDPTSSSVVLPEKIGGRIARHLRFTIFSTYRKIFTVIFTANLVTLIALIVKNHGTPLITDVASASSANLMLAILFRQENFVNLCYEIAVCVPHSVPLSIRRRLAKVFHYGGAHSGSGTSAVAWFILYVALATKEFIQNPSTEDRNNLILSYILIVMFILILAAAHPRFRVRFHDYFEAFHRLAGWSALITFWVHNGLVARAGARAAGIPTGLYLVRSPNFWFFCISTSCTLLSWGRLRRHRVYPEILSDRAIRLHFRYRTMPPFYGLKVSTRPLLEWHAFATIPDVDADGKPVGFSIVVSNAGDWTRGAITTPPRSLWVRGYPLHGLLYTSRLFKRIVVVATGSGIGPCLSLLHADVTPRRVLWSTPHPQETYGAGIVNAVLRADPDALVWNTKTMGRPDMVALTYRLVVESEAEAVFIISNPKLTRKVVYGMQTRGVPAYGAIFDS